MESRHAGGWGTYPLQMRRGSDRPVSLHNAPIPYFLGMDLKPASFVPTPADQLPQDPRGDGTGWTFKTLEHDENTFPHAILATDAKGRSCVYVPLEVDGVIGRWK